MKRLILSITVLALCLFAMSSSALAAFDYSGSISLNGSANGFLTGTGDWGTTGPTTMSWDVSWSGSGLVHYSYTFAVTAHDISHLSLELSDSFTASDITNVTGNFTDYSINTFNGGTAPYNTMPGDMYGIKFNFTSGTKTGTIAFDSTRLPEWGDFYARCGVQVMHELDPTDPDWKQWNSAWNTGFTVSDPTAAASSGSINNHILTPDSVAVVPEPVSSVLFVVGAALFSGRKYIKRRK